jgi:lipoprotein-releasing system permease protein
MRLSNSSRIVLGNLIGIAILLLQKYFGIIKLNPEYYVDQAPVYLNWGYIALLNGLTVSVCFGVVNSFLYNN